MKLSTEPVDPQCAQSGNRRGHENLARYVETWQYLYVVTENAPET